jgi:hypothetical protein
VLTDDQRRAFHDRGYLRLAGAVERDAIDRMRERLWRMLEHRGAMRDDPSTWSSGSTTNLKGLRKGDPDLHDNRVVAGALDELIGPGAWRTGHHWGQVLVTFPNAERWDVPHRPWHLDYGYDYPRDVIWGVNIFLCIDDVLPRGGGTVVLDRSPQLIGHFVDGLRPAERTQKQHRLAFQASHPYLTALADPSETEDRVARFVDVETEVHGVCTRVVELTGVAGDVTICHPWTVHNVAPNALDRPRMMRAARAHHRELLARFGVGLDD